MNGKGIREQSRGHSPSEQAFEDGNQRRNPIGGRVLSHRFAPIVLILLFMISVGSGIVTAYGQSWDEYNNYTFGEKALSAYTNGTFLQDQNEAYFHGTFYFMLFSVTSRLFSDLNNLWDLVDGRHFTNYLTFLFAAICFYILAFRMMGRLWATMTTLIFLTQPLYFGHAFVNPKDIPFMTLFLASVAAGLFATDLWHRGDPGFSSPQAHAQASSSKPIKSLKYEWGEASRARRGILLFLILVGILVVAELFARRWLYPGLQYLVSQAHKGQANPLVTSLFSIFAGQAGRFPLEGYLEKLRVAYLWLRIPAVFLAFLPALVFATRCFSQTYKNHVRPGLLRYGAWGMAGVLLGLAGSVRIFGPFAGALVTLFALYKHRGRTLPALLTYWIIAGLTTYLTWPALWGDPVGSLWERVITASDFDPNVLLFEGQHMLSSQLPRAFVPKLMAFQFTEPAIVLFLIGSTRAVLDIRSSRADPGFISLLFLWFALPLGTQILLRTTVYDNFRHFLFATPPLFLLAGYGLKRFVHGLNRAWVWAPAVLLVILPGIIPIFQYHPYEYAYYNSFAGGVAGAYGRYELDYWCISYREAMAYINANATSGAGILVLGPAEAAREYARADLTVMAEDASIVILDSGEARREFPREDLVMDSAGSGRSAIAYVLTCTSATRGVPHHPELQVVHEVRWGAAVFTTVKAVPQDLAP